MTLSRSNVPRILERNRETIHLAPYEYHWQETHGTIKIPTQNDLLFSFSLPIFRNEEDFNALLIF